MKDLNSALFDLIASAVEAGEVAGASVLVLRDQKVAAHAEAGFADVEQSRPYARDTIARLYSMSKPVTAAAAMLLMDRGLLDLGAPVKEFLPGFQNPVVWDGDRLVPAKRPPRICELLNMTSGIVYGDLSDPSSWQSAAVFDEIREALDRGAAGTVTTVEAANRLGRCPLAFHPGKSWRYGASADVLGAVVEIVSGKRFGEFLQEEFFEPLGMTDTGFFVPEEKQPRLAQVYQQQGDRLVPYTVSHLGISHTMSCPPEFESGGAGLVSTLEDFSRFASMLLSEGSYGGRQFLSPRAVRYFTGGGLLSWQQEELERTWEGLSGYTYGNLMRRLVDPGKAAVLGTQGEYGWDGWLGTYFTNSPEDRLTMLVSLQKKDAGTLAVVRKMKNVIWKELC